MARNLWILLGMLAALGGCNADSYPPLHLAAMSGDAAAVQAELRKGEDANAKDSTGGLPLAYALGGNHYDVAQRLIDGGADVNAEIAPGTTIVDWLDASQETEAGDWLEARGAHRKP